MLILIAAVIALIVCCILICTVKRLYGQVKKLEKQVAEVTSIRNCGLNELAGQLMDDYRENTDTQTKRVDEAIKIFDERRVALENQMNMNRVMADTLVDAFKHRLDEAEKKYQGS